MQDLAKTWEKREEQGHAESRSLDAGYAAFAFLRNGYHHQSLHKEIVTALLACIGGGQDAEGSFAKQDDPDAVLCQAVCVQAMVEAHARSPKTRLIESAARRGVSRLTELLTESDATISGEGLCWSLSALVAARRHDLVSASAIDAVRRATAGRKAGSWQAEFSGLRRVLFAVETEPSLESLGELQAELPSLDADRCARAFFALQIHRPLRPESASSFARALVASMQEALSGEDATTASADDPGVAGRSLPLVLLASANSRG